MNGPFDRADWMGPHRRRIDVLSQAPAGRALLVAAHVPREEIPPAPPYQVRCWSRLR